MNVLVVTYWDRDDPLVVNYTLPYLRIMQRELPAGSKIHLVTLDKEVGMSGEEDADGFIRHSYPYKGFGLAGVGMVLSLVWSLVRLVRKNRIDVVHAWCTPAGMVGYLVSRITGKPLVLDSYEPHAESMVENGTWKRGSVAFRTLFLFEKLQSRRAVAVIAATEGMRAYAQAKYQCVPARFHVKPACVDVKRFDPAMVDKESVRRSMGLEGKLVAVYAGKFGGIYLDQEVFDLFRVASDHWGMRFHALLLTPQSVEELWPYMESAELKRTQFTILWAPPAEVPDLLGLADWALTPVKPVPTKRYCTPIKDGEYWAAGLPVMITEGISDDSEIIATEQIGSVIHSLDTAGYKQAVSEMDSILSDGERRRLSGRIREVAAKYRDFGIARDVYRSVYGVEVPIS
jgi:glycosyltransferase involved in cell wall biosynthesis